MDLLQEGWCVVDSSNDEMLEAWMLFCIAVAGKTAKTTIRSINRFLEPRGELSPFAYIRQLAANNQLETALREAKVGQYTKLTKTFNIVSDLFPDELRNRTPEQLEVIHGIGPKTSRFFIQSTRENTRFAVLDTHILAWMREQGINVPKSTPSKGAYAKIESIYLALADKLGKNPRDLDSEIWLSRAKL